jgi:hypothetical protein
MQLKLCNPFMVRQTVQKYKEGNDWLGASYGVVVADVNAAVKDFCTQRSIDVEYARRLIFGFVAGDENEPLQELHFYQVDAKTFYGIKRWIGAVKPSGGDAWLPRREFMYEALLVLGLALQIISDQSEPKKLLFEWLGEPKVIVTEFGGLLLEGIASGGVPAPAVAETVFVAEMIIPE